MKRVSIGVHLIFRNEETMLEECLSRIQDADEIIAVDTGSSDRSPDIAAAYRARVIHEEWKDDFSSPRNTALRSASTDWILYVDADERLLTPLDEIRDFLSACDGSEEGFEVRIENVLGPEQGHSLHHSAIRLFRNRASYAFRGRLHEDISLSITDSQGGSRCIRTCPVRILHLGYLRDATLSASGSNAAAHHKLARNLRLLEQELAGQPDHPFYLYHMGISLSQAGRLEEALAYMEQAYAKVPLKAAYRPTLVKDYAALLLRSLAAPRCSELLSLETVRYPDYPDLLYMLGCSWEDQGFADKALEAFDGCRSGKPGRYTSVQGMADYLPLVKMGGLYLMLGKGAEAGRRFREALEFRPAYGPALTGLAESLSVCGVTDQEIAAALERFIRAELIPDQVRLAEALMEIGAFRQAHERLALLLEEADDVAEAAAARPLLARYTAQCLVHTGSFACAEVLLRRHIPEPEKDGEALQLLQLCRCALGLEPDGSIDQAEQAVSKELVRLGISLSQPVLADRLSSAGASAEQDRLDYAKTLYREGYARLAAEEFIRLMSVDPGLDLEASRMLAEHLYLKGHYEEAAGALEALFRMEPGCWEAGAGAAICRLRQAAAALEEAIALCPGSKDIAAERQTVLNQVNRLELLPWRTRWTGCRRRRRYGQQEQHHFPMYDRQG